MAVRQIGFLLVLVLGCKGVPATPAPEPYTLTVTVHPGAPKSGGQVGATIVLTNASHPMAGVADDNDSVDWFYDLTGPDGSPVPMTSYGEMGGEIREAGVFDHVIRRDIAPGAALTREVPLDRIFDLRRPGKYRLVVSRSLENPGGDGVVDVHSAPFAFLLSSR